MVDEMSPIPFYVQLADLLAKQIEEGKLKPRQPLPSEATLQQEYGVARGTVRSAVRLLRDRGLVVTFTGRGTFVAEKRP
ncbi:HTH-type transcriptional repressor YvoA [Micromonospora sp. MW-13]|uniref:GntR family transcriptional regulator n=1 Tax=unclassified Micromonospora TaxID=2617518 RepID=UPI000E43C96D|nr:MULTISPECIES: GntR family transcriptional regulator [unclassified Micromonospora]MCX4469364.1 GntR family transcriptional regulator [Micromonospora sp. NBC_01655]RGC68809.1 HTH-type transcriptional repressor YvoA [Micromonospora sp. MW-13]